MKNDISKYISDLHVDAEILNALHTLLILRFGGNYSVADNIADIFFLLDMP